MKSPPGPPMTLGNAAAARVRLIVWCKTCGHQVEPDAGEMAARYGTDTSVLDWRDRLICSGCGSREADMVVTGTDSGDSTGVAQHRRRHFRRFRGGSTKRIGTVCRACQRLGNPNWPGSVHPKAKAAMEFSMGGQPGKPKPPGNPPVRPEPRQPAPIEEPPRPIPVPPVERPPPPMEADFTSLALSIGPPGLIEDQLDPEASMSENSKPRSGEPLPKGPDGLTGQGTASSRK